MSEPWDYLTTEPNALLGWQLGAVTWAEALFRTSARNLLGMYVLAYRHGIDIRRRFADEVYLPDALAWDRLTPVVWKRNPAWHDLWTLQLRRHYALVSTPDEAVKAALQDLAGDGGIQRTRTWEAWSMQRELEKQNRERAAFSAWIRELES